MVKKSLFSFGYPDSAGLIEILLDIYFDLFRIKKHLKLIRAN